MGVGDVNVREEMTNRVVRSMSTASVTRSVKENLKEKRHGQLAQSFFLVWTTCSMGWEMLVAPPASHNRTPYRTRVLEVPFLPPTRPLSWHLFTHPFIRKMKGLALIPPSFSFYNRCCRLSLLTRDEAHAHLVFGLEAIKCAQLNLWFWLLLLLQPQPAK